MNLRIFSLLSVVAVAFTASAFAKVKTETVTYKDGSVELEGFLTYDDSVKGPRPGVLVIHDWTGLQDYTKSRAAQPFSAVMGARNSPKDWRNPMASMAPPMAQAITSAIGKARGRVDAAWVMPSPCHFALPSRNPRLRG